MRLSGTGRILAISLKTALATRYATTGKAGNHNRQAIQTLSDLTGRNLPQPSYNSDGKSHAQPNSTERIYNALSDEAKAAVDMLPVDTFTDEYGVDHSADFADAITIANREGPQMWALNNSGSFTALNVQQYNVITLHGTLRYVIDPSLVEGISKEELEPFYSWTDYPENLGMVQIRIDFSVPESIRSECKRVNRLVVQRLAATNWKRSSQAHNHSDTARVKLALLTDKVIPAPSYFPKDFYGQIWGSASSTISRVEDLDPSLLRWFIDQGLAYTREQISTFYTALQTKGFVVLSGISGTGKSKIAQGFVEMLPDPQASEITSPFDLDDVITLSIKPYMRKYCRAIIPIKQLNLLPMMAPNTSIDIDLRLDGAKATGRLECRQHSENSILHVLYFHGDVGKAIEQLPTNQPFYLTPVYGEDDEHLERIDIATDPENVDSDEKPELLREPPRNNLFLAVRPDWRDSTSLLGYYNPLTETYEWTEFLRFLLRARESYEAKDGLAWFVILDEMNLAHVEYYFADLLSIIESGRDDDGYSREPLRFSYPETVQNTAPPKELRLPPNLYIIGTVNMDETTPAFSPKVLDRAFTIELVDVDFKDYPPEPSDSATTMTEEDKRALLDAFTRQGTFAQVNKADIREVVDRHEEIRGWLDNLNTLLMRHRFHFGYRVFDEIAQFVFNADDNKMFDRWEDAFGDAVYMKVLPKFNGSRARLHNPLMTLVAWSINPDGPDVDFIKGRFEAKLADGSDDIATIATGARFPAIADRGLQMLLALEQDGFVSFG